MTATATPVGTEVELTRHTGDLVVATATIDRDDPVFAGHYPGFPVYPGVYLVELVDRTVRSALPAERLALRSLGQCRFRSPLYPGDELAIEASLARGGGDLRVAATVGTGRGTAAQLRLRYRPEEDR